MPDKLCILVCQNLAREVAAVIELEGLTDLGFATFPSDCGRPQSGWDDLERIVRARREEFSQFCFLGGCLATRQGDPPQELKLCTHDETGLCFHLFINREVVDDHMKKGVYLLTPGWLAHWRRYVDEWGFDREAGRAFFAESATRLLLLDTGVDEKSLKHLHEFADFAGLDFDVLPVGLDFFRLALNKVVMTWRLEQAEEKSAAALGDAHRQSADYAMVLDLIGSLTRLMTEQEVIENILELYTMLFGPRRLLYLPLVGGKPGELQARPTSPDGAAENLDRLINLRENHTWTESGDGFLLRIDHRDETLGILEVKDVAFPEYRERYLNVALAIARVCGLAINNARIYQEIKWAEEQLQHYAAELEHSNKEVRQFAYIVSHDLRAPLVNLRGFATELRFALDDVQDTLNRALSHLNERERQVVTVALEKDVPEALDFIDSATTRMDNFISALLKLSRLGRRELCPESIDVQALVQASLQTLAHQIEQRRVQITVGPLPQVVADHTSLEQIIDNLLSNAVKYLSPDRPGEIAISAERGKVETTFCVQDNGRGIAAEDMPKVFAPFRRAGRQDVPGEGMGLAYVQALVRRHGGRIWCDSQPGVGTNFTFTISNRLARGAVYE